MFTSPSSSLKQRLGLRPGRWRLVGLATAVVAILVFYALSDIPSLPHDHALAGADWLGAAVCHRITERSWVVNGRQFPLCARCTGMYLGVALTFGLLGLAGRWRHGDFPPRPILLILLGFIALMAIDGLNSFSHFFPTLPHLYEPRNWLRLLTGMGAGLAMGCLVFPALAQTLWAQPPDRLQPVIGSWRELGGLLAVAAVAIALLLTNQTAVLYSLALLSALGILLVVAALNGILLLIGLKKDGQATRWLATAVPLSLSLILALVELSAISWLRFSLIGTLAGFPGL